MESNRTKPLDPEDPLALVGVGLDEDPSDEALSEMAWSLVEEYVRMGWTGERILRVFHNPFFRLPHRILQLKGEAFVRSLIDTVDDIRGQVQQQVGARP